MEIVSISYCVPVKDIMKIMKKEFKQEQFELYDYLALLKGVNHILYDSHAGDVVYFTIDKQYDCYELKRRIKQIIKSFESFNYKAWGIKGWV